MRAEASESVRPAFDAIIVDGVVRLTGGLVFTTAAAAFAKLLALLPRSGSLEVDLSALESSDSAGLAALVEWRAEAAKRGLHMCFAGAGKQLHALARLADLDAELFR